MKKLTPILTVDEIEPCLPFWKELGFQVTMQVPTEDDPSKLGFAMLQSGSVELMYQTQKSLEADLPKIAKEQLRGFLYLEVENLAELEKRLNEMKVLVPKRKTFYGATEIVIEEAKGHIVIFAQMGAE